MYIDQTCSCWCIEPWTSDSLGTSSNSSFRHLQRVLDLMIDIQCQVLCMPDDKYKACSNHIGIHSGWSFTRRSDVSVLLSLETSYQIILKKHD
jgi:hypothetical protein